MGAGGNAGFSIGDDLTRGTSGVCETFANEVLSGAEYFKITHLEIWALV
jgi:hypothetical protein